MERLKKRISEHEDRKIEITPPKKEKKINLKQINSRTYRTVTTDLIFMLSEFPPPKKLETGEAIKNAIKTITVEDFSNWG